ncbi:IS701 family transposase [Streptomyces sp. NPDC058964]|uniref:IS701 family transposase n=1 Tax=Streptomyces sp. NPDC058964 TaxID=3346681 RepID=UPI0036B57A37
MTAVNAVRRLRPEVPDATVAELCAELFALLPRADQREKGAQYLYGLLTADGRKTARNIAAHVGGGSAEQSLHHFVSSSTWDWMPVRAALCRYLERVLRPRAWVARPLVIPKAGRHSVGVARRFVPSLGQVVNSQEALGIWAVDEEASAPVHWRLMCHEERRSEGTAAGRLRSDAGHPTVTDAECVAATALEVRGWGLGTPRPVVVDLPDCDPHALVRLFDAERMPLLGAVRGATRVTIADRGRLPCDTDREVSAQQLLKMIRAMRRPVTWRDPEHGVARTSLVATVQVTLAPSSEPVLLIGEWSDPHGWPQRYWISNLTAGPAGALLRLTKLALRAETDFARISVPVGLVDFEGRSFNGWHRHITLASAAHAVRALTVAPKLNEPPRGDSDLQTA